jgi:RHS repeat-associated protein
MTYDPAGRLAVKRFPDGNATSYSYDPASRLLSILSDGSKLPGIRYAYDLRGNRVSMDRTDDGVSRYQYDEISQLIKAELADGDVQTYTFDPVGNRLTLTDRRGVQAYSYDAADQLLQIESTFNPQEPDTTGRLFVRSAVPDTPNRPIYTTTYSFDAAGNELGYTGPGNRTTKHEFDTLNRLTSVSSPGSEPVIYQYDAEGRRAAIASQNGNIKERFLYSGLGRSVLADMDGKGEIKARYITMPGGQLLARVDSSSNKPNYYHFDALGSTVAVTDAKGRVVSRSTYDPYGARRSHPATDDRYGFVGNEWVKDEGNGLMQMGARFYRNDTGIFITRDILLFYGLLVPAYSYARNNPLAIIDPSGFDGEHTGCSGGDSPHRHVMGPHGLMTESCSGQSSQQSPQCGQPSKAPVGEVAPATVGAVAAVAAGAGASEAAGAGAVIGTIIHVAVHLVIALVFH